MNDDALQQALAFFETRFGKPAVVGAFAPGRVEVLGNHTDYNEGYVLSAAIDRGTYFLAGRRSDNSCRLADAMHPELETRFAADDPHPVLNPLASARNYEKVRSAAPAFHAKLGDGEPDKGFELLDF